MKAKFIAVYLSLSVITIPVHALGNPQDSLINPSQSAPPVVTQKIDINKADVTRLVGSFKGIGKKRAEAIIAYRESHHGFKSLEELADVKGFGQKFIETNREKLNAVFVIN